MAPNRRRKPITLKPGQDPASLPLKHPPRELFAQAVARGLNVDQAYRDAGYTGNSASRRELRCSADVDTRIRWLLVQRIESDAQIRARGIQKEQDARLRLIARLEAIAYADPRDIAQWDRKPVFDRDGNIKGWKNEIEVTPSRLLTPEQAAQVKIVTTKGGSLKFEVADRLQALAQLAKVLGLTLDQTPQTVNNTQVNVGQVNVMGELTALEAARRLAFALEKAKRAVQAAPPFLDATTATDAREAVPFTGSQKPS
jgi:hypothetical protein